MCINLCVFKTSLEPRDQILLVSDWLTVIPASGPEIRSRRRYGKRLGRLSTNENEFLRKIPVIAGETESVSKGALITYGLDYYELGKQTAEMAVKILTEGADPATMSVESQKTPKLVINTTAAERMGVTIPQSLLDKADETVK